MDNEMLHKGIRFNVSLRKSDTKLINEISKVQEAERDKSNFTRTLMMYGLDFCKERGIEVTPDIGYFNFLGKETKSEPASAPKYIEKEPSEPIVIEEKSYSIGQEDDDLDLEEKLFGHIENRP